MDDKTEELRDIFVEATGEDTVTERQEEPRGTIADVDVEERVVDIIQTMQERYEFETDRSIEDLCRIVKCFFDGDDDETIADAIDADTDTVFRARMDLHLVRENDRDAPFDLDELRQHLIDGASVEECADEFGVDEETVRQYGTVIETDREATRANERFRYEFAELLTDEELSEQFVQDAREDGLEEATEDIETDVSF